MFLEIVTPEAVLFSSDIDSISVTGLNGDFQMLNNHAAIVSILKKGTIGIHVHTQEHLELNELNEQLVPHTDDAKILTLQINSGTIEMKNNKVILLVE